MSVILSVPPNIEDEGPCPLVHDLTFRLHPRSLFPTNSPSSTSETTKAQFPSLPKLQLIEHLAYGNIWDFILAQHSIYGKVVIKTVFLQNLPCIDPGRDEYMEPSDILKHALREERFYMKDL